MNNDPVNTAEPTEQEEPRIERRGRGLTKTHNPFSTGERSDPPRIINILHQPPKPKPPHWRVPEEAQAKLTEARAAAEKARQEIEQIEDHYRDRERDLDELKHNIRAKTKELDVFRRGLADLEPSTLAQRWESAYWKHFHDPFDRDIANQWLLVASLRSNSKELRAMLTRKLEEGEALLAAMEQERAALEKELGEETEAASIE
jgi:hypothetical protein